MTTSHSNEDYFYDETADRLARGLKKFEDAGLFHEFKRTLFRFKLKYSKEFGKWKFVLELPPHLQDELIETLLNTYRRIYGTKNKRADTENQ